MNTTPNLSWRNIFDSPGSSWAGLSAVLGVVASAMASGVPTTLGGWVTFGVAVATGLGAIFSKA